eukprot:693567-Amphidinium_carterae.3
MVSVDVRSPECTCTLQVTLVLLYHVNWTAATLGISRESRPKLCHARAPRHRQHACLNFLKIKVAEACVEGTCRRRETFSLHVSGEKGSGLRALRRLASRNCPAYTGQRVKPRA